MKFIGVTLVLVILLSGGCGKQEYYNSEANNENTDGSLNTSIDSAVIADWTSYMQSSDNGLWEDQPEYANMYDFRGHLYDEESLEIPVYSPFAVCCYSDTIFVTDASTKEVVALDTNGTVLWKAGGEGEVFQIVVYEISSHGFKARVDTAVIEPKGQTFFRPVFQTAPQCHEHLGGSIYRNKAVRALGRKGIAQRILVIGENRIGAFRFKMDIF